MGGECRAYGEDRDIYRILVGNLDGKKQPKRRRRRWEENI